MGRRRRVPREATIDVIEPRGAIPRAPRPMNGVRVRRFEQAVRDLRRRRVS